MSDLHHNLKKKEKISIIPHWTGFLWTGFLPTSWENHFGGFFCTFSFVPHLGGGWKDEGSEWGDSFESHHVMKIIWWFLAKIQKIIKSFWVKISDSIAYLWIHFKNPTCLLPSTWVIAPDLRGSRIFAASWEKLSGGVDRSRRFGSEIAWNTGSGGLLFRKFPQWWSWWLGR